MKTLEAWLEEEKMQQLDAAPLLGVSQPHLSGILSGKRPPSFKFIESAFRLSKGAVRPDSFFQHLFVESGTIAAQ